MGRVKITEAVLGRQQSGVAVLLDGASVQVNDSAGDPATVYEEAVGGTTLSNPLTSDDGRLPGFVDEGYYELVVTYDGDTADAVPFEARAAYPSGGATGEVLAVASGGGVEWSDPNDLLGSAPWIIDIDPFMTPSTGTPNRAANSSYIGGGYVHYGTTVDNEVGWDVIMAAGTWTIEFLCDTANDAGIATVSIDGVPKGTIDTYSGSSIPNVLKQLTGVDVDTTGKKRLLFKQATKNGSSSAYALRLQKVRLLRTA